MRWEIEIPVEPVAMPRPRVMHGKSGQVFTLYPGYVGKIQAQIREFVMERIGASFGRNVPVKLSVTFYVKKPRSVPKKAKYPTVRPDLDQYLKLLLDALAKYVYDDDAQIVAIEALKVYDSYPHIKLRIEEVG